MYVCVLCIVLYTIIVMLLYLNKLLYLQIIVNIFKHIFYY